MYLFTKSEAVVHCKKLLSRRMIIATFAIVSPFRH